MKVLIFIVVVVIVVSLVGCSSFFGYDVNI